jgi:hypothetical protein
LNLKKKISLLSVFAFLLIGNLQVAAQCAMCKTSVESDLDSGSSIATGLNTGILYLMAIPYLVMMIGGYFFFRKQIDAKVKILKDRYFPSKSS